MLYAICYIQDDEEGGAVLAQEAEAVTRTYTHSLALTHAFDPLPAFTTYTDDFRCCFL